MEIKELSLEELIEGLEITQPEDKPFLMYQGVYVPDEQRIFYNSLNIRDKGEFYVTIIHELMHHYYFDDYVPHNEFDIVAERILGDNPEYKKIIDNYVRWDK